MVRIRAFQAWGPGSIPGRRTNKKDIIFLFASYRQQQDLNLRGETPFDFESNALDHSAILTNTLCFEKNNRTTPTGFEPAISRFVVSRLIRWATGSCCNLNSIN